MSEIKEQLGIYWENKSLYVVNAIGTEIKDCFEIPHNINVNREDLSALTGQENPLSHEIQNALKSHNILSRKVSLSLLNKDIIFRSFIIPWMPPSEVKNVVSFEASKYIPFSLEDLSYNYHPMTVESEKNKHYRIIFVAIKKDTLENYTRILQGAELTVELIEPSVVSLVRLLQSKEHLSTEKTVALVDQDEKSGKIIILFEGIPQFVREFKLTSPDKNESVEDMDTLSSRLTNEVRISLDYFTRQDNSLRIEELILISNTKSEASVENLHTELGYPVNHIPTNTLLSGKASQSGNYANSFGACLAQHSGSLINFNLTSSGSKRKQFRMNMQQKPIDKKRLAMVGAICLVLVVGVFFFSQTRKKSINSQHLALKQQLGDFSGLKKSSIEEAVKALKQDYKNLSNIRTQTDISSYAKQLQSLLPEGVWLDEIVATYKPAHSDSGSSYQSKSNEEKIPEEKLQILIKGFAYHENVRKQFQLTNTLLRSIKNDKLFNERFEDIDIIKSQTEQIQEHRATYFEISGQ